MNRTTPERRANRRRKIAQRKRLINSLNESWTAPGVDFCEFAEIKDGYLDNNNDMNKYGSGGRAKKTKSKHGHASYRHSGAYGKSIDRSMHDQRQVDSMDEQEIDIDSLTAPLCAQQNIS